MKKPSISELKALIEQGLENIHFPYVKGNSVRIGNMVVRTSKNGNFVFDMKCKKQVAHTFIAPLTGKRDATGCWSVGSFTLRARQPVQSSCCPVETA